MRLHRFFIEETIHVGLTIVIHDQNILHQWRKVFRFTTGHNIIVFDGSGFEYKASIIELTKENAHLLIKEKSPAFMPQRTVWLCLSVIKKDNFEWVVEKATELGVSHIVPVLSDRTEKKSLNLDRLCSIAKEATEQSGLGIVPIVHKPIPLKEVFNTFSFDQNVDVFFGDTVSVTDAVVNNKEKTIKKADVTALFIGPEGGWSDADRSFLNEHGTPVSFGHSILRAETAAIVGVYSLLTT